MELSFLAKVLSLLVILRHLGNFRVLLVLLTIVR